MSDATTAMIAATAGAFAWWLFDQMRFWFPAPDVAPTSRFVQWLYLLLYKDAMAHLSVGAIAFMTAIALSYGAAWWFDLTPDMKAAAAFAWGVATNIHHWRKR